MQSDSRRARHSKHKAACRIGRLLRNGRLVRNGRLLQVHDFAGVLGDGQLTIDSPALTG